MSVQYEAPKYSTMVAPMLSTQCLTCGALTTDMTQHTAWHAALYEAIARAMFP